MILFRLVSFWTLDSGRLVFPGYCGLSGCLDFFGNRIIYQQCKSSFTNPLTQEENCLIIKFQDFTHLS
jgi:hypothetical protein